MMWAKSEAGVIWWGVRDGAEVAWFRSLAMAWRYKVALRKGKV